MENFLTKSQKKVAYYAAKNKNLFIEGVAGTGKTFLLKSLQKLTKKNVELYATSGIASINLGGYTISSHNGLKLKCYKKTDEEIKASFVKNSKKYVENTIIIIDEIGLLSTEQFRQIDIALRARGYSKKFLGGFQVILAGDFRQMPSIDWGETLENSNYLKSFLKIELVENVRQKNDVPFFNILQEVRTEGITNKVAAFICDNHNPNIKEGITIVATRQLMDELNNKISAPNNAETKIYKCNINDENRLYDKIKLWVGMPIIICRTSYQRGYFNGDTGRVVEFDEYDNEVLIKLDRTGYNVWVQFEKIEFIKKEKFRIEFFYGNDGKIKQRRLIIKNESYMDNWEIDEDLNENIILNFPKEVQNILNNYSYYKPEKKGEKYLIVEDKECYSLMPLLPAHFLSIRRCQGLTLTNGILHESILNAFKYNNKDAINIQYVALSRFEKISQLHMEGIETPILKESKKLEILF